MSEIMRFCRSRAKSLVCVDSKDEARQIPGESLDADNPEGVVG